jgi:hypothetical protein
MRNSIHDLAQEALFLAGRCCSVCAIPGDGTPLLFGGADDGRTGYLDYLDKGAVWRDRDTGEVIDSNRRLDSSVQWDEFPPSGVGVGAINLSRSDRMAEANIVVRCGRHMPRGGRRVE